MWFLFLCLPGGFTAPKNCTTWWKYLISYLSYLPVTLRIKATHFIRTAKLQTDLVEGANSSAALLLPVGEILTASSPAKPWNNFSVAELYKFMRAQQSSAWGLSQRAVSHSILVLLPKGCEPEHTATAPSEAEWSLLPAAIPQKCRNSTYQRLQLHLAKVTGRVQIKLSSSASASASTCSKS